MTAAPAAQAAATREGEVLVVQLSGDWRMTEDRPRWTDLWRAAHADGGAPAVVRVRGEAVGVWDSSIALFLNDVRQGAEGAGARVEFEQLPEGVARLTGMLSRKATSSAATPLPNLVSVLGLAATGLWYELRDMSRLIGECAFSVARFVQGRAQFRWRDCVSEMQQCGAMALPIVGLISFLVGVTLAYTGAVAVRKYGGDIYVADIVGVAITREMGPMMMAIVLAGRTGAAFAATLGNMKANEEIDALETLGVSRIDFLVMPRLVALCLMTPFLALYADCLGILGGMVIAASPPLNIPPSLYFAEMKTIVDLSDINTGLVKAVVFGVLIGISGCLRGLQADRSAAGVGIAATRAVVTGILLIIVADTLLAVVFNMLDW